MATATGRVLVAGATGALGRHVLQQLRGRGATVRVLARDEARGKAAGGDELHVGEALRPETLAGALDGVHTVFSCLGASVQPSPKFGRATFSRVDWPANRNLVDAAKAAGVRRFVYVSVYGGRDARQLDYMDAHERVVDHLRESGLSYGIVRPTGFFSAFDAFLELARKGRAPVIGDGACETNPIDDRDLAVVCADLVQATANEERDVGGPQILQRKDIAALACRVQGVPEKAMRTPAGAMRAIAAVARPFQPRIADVIAFVTHVSTSSCVAPAHGTRTLDAYFRERLASGG